MSILDYAVPRKRTVVGRPKGSIGPKSTSKYKITYHEQLPISRTRLSTLPTVDNLAAFEALKRTRDMLYKKMINDYVDNGELTQAAKSRGWESVEQAEKEIIKAIQIRIDANIDWDDVESWLYR